MAVDGWPVDGAAVPSVDGLAVDGAAVDVVEDSGAADGVPESSWMGSKTMGFRSLRMGFDGCFRLRMCHSFVVTMVFSMGPAGPGRINAMDFQGLWALYRVWMFSAYALYRQGFSFVAHLDDGHFLHGKGLVLGSGWFFLLWL